jgi:hypothetical protein
MWQIYRDWCNTLWKFGFNFGCPTPSCFCKGPMTWKCKTQGIILEIMFRYGNQHTALQAVCKMPRVSEDALQRVTTRACAAHMCSFLMFTVNRANSRQAYHQLIRRGVLRRSAATGTLLQQMSFVLH